MVLGISSTEGCVVGTPERMGRLRGRSHVLDSREASSVPGPAGRAAAAACVRAADGGGGRSEIGVSRARIT